jgi:hypothetical protein
MSLQWRQATGGESFDGYHGELLTARVVRYGDYDHAAGHVERGRYWQGFLNGPDAPEVPGRHDRPEDAQRAVERALREV